MERESEFNNSHYVSGRLGVWCPVCGANEGRSCIPSKHIGLRFTHHNQFATGTVPRPVIIPEPWDHAEVPVSRTQLVRHKYKQVDTAGPNGMRRSVTKPGWTPGGWVN